MSAIEEATNWLANDPDETDRAELGQVIEAARRGEEAAIADLEDRFAAPLTFGTAGLRGKMGAGKNRMCTAVVTCAAQGLCEVLREHLKDGFKVVVGYDARYRSADFAKLTAGIVVANGGQAYLFPKYYPTPLTAYALRKLDADAAVMVTASHNPPQDNGYKVYLGGRIVTGNGSGAQIVPPWDSLIHQKIQAVPSAKAVKVATSGWETVPDSVIENYLVQAASLAKDCPTDLRIVLTSMHGVGGETCVRALHKAGFTDIHEVVQQRDPDPDFPTVAFPNPEEAGALDLALELAAQVDADLVLANDPDADRCSAAIKTVEGKWQQLSGDQIGALLGSQAALDYQGQEGACLARSVVSSSLLDSIAEAHNLRSAVTLTGFKWISRAEGIVFGYEEAIGYCTDPTAVLDKDGISAAVSLARLAANLKAQGKSLAVELEELAKRYGLYYTAPLTFRVEDLSLIKQGMARLRETNGPATLAGRAVTVKADLAKGYQGLEPTDGLLYATEKNDRVIARPSGTEPKLKCYLETVVKIPEGDSLEQAEAEAKQRIELMKKEMTQALGF